MDYQLAEQYPGQGGDAAYVSTEGDSPSVPQTLRDDEITSFGYAGRLLHRGLRQR